MPEEKKSIFKDGVCRKYSNVGIMQNEEKKCTLEDPKDKYIRIIRKFGLVNLIKVLRANECHKLTRDMNLLGKIDNDLKNNGYAHVESIFGIKTIQCLNGHIEVKDGLGDSYKHEIYQVK